jgi:hemerythrin superfamily protein
VIENVNQTQLIKLQTSLSLVHLDKLSKDAYIESFNSNFSGFIDQYSMNGIDPKELKGRKRLAKDSKLTEYVDFVIIKTRSPQHFQKKLMQFQSLLAIKK